MTTYTVCDNCGEPIREHVSQADAARELLWYDGHDFEIRPSPTGHDLWITQFSRNSTLGSRPMVKSVFFSLSPDLAKAEGEIFAKVIDQEWHGAEAMTDEAFAAMKAKIVDEADC
jgi:hypothetical protein